jgi:hypothetical protein
MFSRIDANDASGLSYQQNGTEHRSPHFDLTALKTAWYDYLDGYDVWEAAGNWAAMKDAWRVVGLAQRDVPAHVAQEYCRRDRSFYPCPFFDEPTLPRVLTFQNTTTHQVDSWFPLTSSNSGLGSGYGLIRGTRGPRNETSALQAQKAGLYDLAAITCLDEVRTADLVQSREHLNPLAVSHGLSM